MLPDTEGEPLPSLYAQWITELLGGAIPRELRATCDACAMCAREEQKTASASYFFDPVVKCCSYVPDLHNFLVGRILSDTDPRAQQGRATVQTRIADAVGVTPLGLKQPPVYAQLYGRSSKALGRSRALRCPYYLEPGNLCGIWRNRESTCVTWFCKHVRGDLGYIFWREHEFFCRCGELVSLLGWTNVLAICGPNTRAYARLTQEAYRRLTADDIPSNLSVGRFEVLQVQRAMMRVNTYNDFDPLDIPNTVMELLQYFDGRLVVDALAAIADVRGVSLDAALVRKMVDFKLLVPPEMPVSTREIS